MTAARIAEALSGGKAKSRNGNWLVPCPAHDDSSPSLSLRDGDNGLLVHCFAGCSPGDIFAAIRRKAGHKALEPGDTAPEPIKGSFEYERRQHEKAAWLWNQRKPLAGTAAERYYLREARGITCPLPATLGFLPSLKRERHPALITAFGLVDEPEPGVCGAPRDVGAVHLTLLKADGSGKAEVERNKLIIGSPRGLPMVLAQPNDLLGMGITEGIEDGLTVHQSTGLGVWAAGSAGMMPKLAERIPDYIEAITIYAHADQAGMAGARDLARTLQRRDPRLDIRVEGLPSSGAVQRDRSPVVRSPDDKKADPLLAGLKICADTERHLAERQRRKRLADFQGDQ